MTDIERFLEGYSIKIGGEWSPSNCQPQHRVAIIVPYKNREENLRMFLRHMHPFLSRQLIEYRIFLVEPVQNVTFNRGLLMNIGYKEASKFKNWDCYVYHDVDMLPEDERNLYSCHETPKHFSSAVNVFKYQ
jgi:beta-1,4-galactosyltransferase 1